VCVCVSLSVIVSFLIGGKWKERIGSKGKKNYGRQARHFCFTY
jgi:hypothetical protein